jgi:predicted  nucleic acid-binding Zn-ribbon protein
MSKEKIEKLKVENEKLREQVIYLQQDIERLELQISGLRNAVAIGRRGLPWN